MSTPSARTLLWLNATLLLALVVVVASRHNETSAKQARPFVPLPLAQLNGQPARAPGAQPGSAPAAGGAGGAAAAPRAHGQYLMLSGRVQGANTNALYLIDTANQELVALKWNRSAGRLEALGYRSLQADAGATVQQVPGRNSGGGGR